MAWAAFKSMRARNINRCPSSHDQKISHPGLWLAGGQIPEECITHTILNSAAWSSISISLWVRDKILIANHLIGLQADAFRIGHVESKRRRPPSRLWARVNSTGKVFHQMTRPGSCRSNLWRAQILEGRIECRRSKPRQVSYQASGHSFVVRLFSSLPIWFAIIISLIISRNWVVSSQPWNWAERVLGSLCYAAISGE